MEQMIARADFMHTHEDDMQHEFTAACTRWLRENRDSITVQQAQAILRALQDKVCHPDFPSQGTSGFHMAFHLLKELQSVISGLIDDGKASQVDFQGAYLEFILQMIQAGLNSSHIDYTFLLRDDSKVNFKEYFQTLRGDTLCRVVRLLKKEYKPDPGMDWRTFYSRSFDKFYRVFICDGLSTEQFQEAHHEFLDLYVFFNLGFKDRDQETRKATMEFAHRIATKYDRNIFKGLQDVGLLTRTLEELSEVVLVPEFPQAQDVDRKLKDDLSNILKAVSEDGLIGSMYDVIMDLALNLTIRKAGCEETREYFEVIGRFFFHIKKESVNNNGDLFEGLVKKFIYVLDHVKDEVYLTYRFVEPLMNNCLNEAMGTSEQHVGQWIAMIKALLRHSVPECIMTAREAMRKQGKVLKWKKYPEDIKEIFALMCEVTFPKWLTDEQMEKGMKEFENLSSYFLDEAKKAGIAKLELTGPMLEFVFHCLEMLTPQAYSLAETVASRLEFNQKKDKELMMEVFRRVTTLVEDDSHDWEDMETRDLGNTVRELIDKAINCVKDGKAFTFEEYDELIYLAKISLTKMNTLTEPITSALFTVYTVVSMRVANWLTTMNEGHRLIPLIPGMIELMESEEEMMRQIGSGAMAMVSQSAGSLFSQYLGRLIECFLETEQDMVLMAVSNSYEHNPAPMEKHFDALFEYIDSGNASARSYVLQILQKVAKRQPHLFTEEKVEAVVKEAKEDQMHQVMILMILADLAKRRLDRVEPFIDDFMNPDLWQPISAHSVVSILQVYGLDAEEKADQVIKHLLGRVKASEDHNEVLFSLNAIRLIGFKHRPAIEKHRRSIEEFKDSTSDNDLHASVTYILDMLDGKSLDKIADELREVQGDLAELDVRVTTTEKDVSGVKDTVQRHGDDLDNVKNDVSEQGQRLDQVEGTVDETAAKVQEIDGKTLSHAPYWARDVSRLLNVETDNDWRLLSLRLGYSNDDIRAWAQQADPCMAMLNEWYTTHKTREATHAVLTSLQLLDREDAAVIVENAMKAAEEVVDDTEFEYATPPDIFLSYQWGHQNEVRLLRQHLEMAGFSCWMDVGQMGGGDKLFEKIDTGIRGAKVIISCVTTKYAKSPNCNREVNLAVNLGKPIFPLLMEKTTWPPPGSMGPIFSEYLFIRFFQRAGEETPDQRYWPLPKFQELLMQLSINGVKPDQQAIQPEYKDWWVPKVEAVMVDKDRAKKQTSASSAPAVDDKKVAESPDVFISYQWGKQPQILKLYQRLTSLGYTCWLDIMQMGGGDSLYDKIDRGLRGCRVVLSCVTTKYAKSANCRREVSLADALQKPLVPLLLEGLAWPPPGPMSPVLTGLLYVDCTRDNMEESWAGPKFDQIIAIINQHVPAPHGGQESAGRERKDQEKGGRKSDGSVVNQQVPSPQEGGGKGSDGGTGGESNGGESGGTKSKVSVPPSSAQPAEKQQRVESKPQQEVQPVAVRKAQVAPASRAPEDGTDGDTNNSSKLSAQKEEQKPAVHGTSVRKQSNASSVQSDLGHDANNPSNLRSAGLFGAEQSKSSACCAIL